MDAWVLLPLNQSRATIARMVGSLIFPMLLASLIAFPLNPVLKAQNNEGSKSARVGAAVRERAPIPLDKNPANFNVDTMAGHALLATCRYPTCGSYSLMVSLYHGNWDELICTRAYGMNGTPSSPWKLFGKHTWSECFDMVKQAFPQTEEFKYMQQSLIEDFMKNTYPTL